MHNEHLEEKKSNYFPVIIIVVLLGLLAWLLLHNFKGEGNGNMWAGNADSTGERESYEGKAEEKHASVMLNPAELGTLDTLSGNFIYNTGTETELKLPDGTMIKAGDKSSEAKLIRFLSDEKMTVDTLDKKQGWISMDRLYFETGKSVITPESENQLKNIAAILKAFPAATVKVGGYTDSTGSAEGNMKLSDSRAKAAMSSLVSSTIPASRLEAKGYGSEHAIADNTTPEGRALNRRIDIRVTKK